MKEREEKNQLSIRLAEPVIYLKDVDFSGRCLTHNELSPPSMVRGILVLHLSKPTKISSIGIELTARSATRWPEGAGSRRIEVTEEHQLYSASTVFFQQEPGEQHSRRATSLGPTSPTVAMDEDDRFPSDLEPDHEDEGSSHADARRVRDPLRTRRRATLDSHNFHSDAAGCSTATHIPPPNYVPSAQNTSGDSRASSAATLSSTQLTPPPDWASPTRSDSDALAQPNPPTTHRDRGLVRGATVPGTSSASPPPTPASRKRASQALEDFRRALIRSSFNPTSHRSHQPTLSRIDTNIVASPISSPIHTPPNEESSRLPSVRTPSESNGGRNSRRRSKRFSFSSISNAIKESLKPRSPLISKKKIKERSVSVNSHDGENTGEVTRGRSKEKGKRVSRDISQALVKVSEVFGLEPEEGKEFGDGWKEFKKGTYKYPISFAIPADSPPSLDCMFGSIIWTLTATVHRPGKFIPRMEIVRTINVVASPSDDATEDVESVTVNKSWADQMVYCLSIVGRAFHIGSKIPIQLTFLPLANIKIHRVSVVIDEKVTYFSEMQKVAKAPKATRQVLCSLKYPDKARAPILPLTEEDPRKSPLYVLVGEDFLYSGRDEAESAEELIAEWMSPGPWPLRFNAEIINTYGALRPTNMNKKGNITVSHVLTIIIRVEKGNTDEEDGGSPKKQKLYDIIIQYPIHLLSHLCDQKYTSLPAYSPTWNSVVTLSGQPSFSESESGPSHIVREVSSPIERESPIPKYSASKSPTQKAPLTEREQLTLQFERLLTGQEAETGQPPPSYRVSTPVHTHSPHVLPA